MLQRKEMTSLLINVISIKMLLTFPKIMIINSGNSAWLQAIYNTIVVFLLFLLICLFYRGTEGIIELAGKFGGRGLRVFVGLLVFLVLLINCVSIIRIFPETVKIVLLQDFRVEFIIVAYLVAIAIGAYMGIEALGKINHMFMPIAGFVLLAFLLLLIPYYRTENILPLFGEGLDKLFVKGFNTISLFSDIIILNVLLSHCENLYEARKSGRRAIIISGVIATVILLSYGLIYAYPVSRDFMIPVYQMSRIIHLSSFFSRFEAMFQFIWSILMLLYGSVYIYALCFTWKKTFALKEQKPLIFPIVVIIGILGMLPGSVVELIKLEGAENMLVYPIVFVLPILFGLVSRKYYNMKKD